MKASNASSLSSDYDAFPVPLVEGLFDVVHGTLGSVESITLTWRELNVCRVLLQAPVARVVCARSGASGILGWRFPITLSSDEPPGLQSADGQGAS